MASNYPGSLDSLTNPSPTDSELTVSHSAQHANANDAIEAIQAELGTDPAGSEATVAARLTAIEATGTGVSGPGSSTDNALVRWDGTGGDTVQNSGVTVDDSGNVTFGGRINGQNITGTTSTGIGPNVSAAGGYSVAIGNGANTSAQNAIAIGRGVTASHTGSVAIGRSAADTPAATTTTDEIVLGTSAHTVNAPGNVTVGGDIELGSGGPTITTGTGSPESAVSAPVGSLYTRTDGSTSTTLYVKESGTGSTGWRAV